MRRLINNLRIRTSNLSSGLSSSLNLNPYPINSINNHKPSYYLKFCLSIFCTILLIFLLSFPVDNIPSMIATLPTVVPTVDAYGFSSSLDSLSSSQLDQRLADMKATGANWVRFDVSWDKVQSQDKNHYDWSAYDAIEGSIKKHDMHGLGIIDFSPLWARDSNCLDSKMCGPKNVSDFADFSGAVVRRYSPSGIKDWEIWNEPNISFRFHPKADPEKYTELLKAAYIEIKKSVPTSFVIVGGTAPSATDSNNLRPADFLDQIYNYGAKGYFDAVAAHPYTYPDSPSDNLPLGAWAQLQTMHNSMVSHGDGNKKIWITEFGAPTSGPNLKGEYVTETQQAQILTDAISIFHSYSWSGPFFWYDYKDTGKSTRTSENFYGLIRDDNSHKPAYDVWVKAITEYR